MTEMTELVRDELARVLGCDPTSIDPATRLVDAGLDSAGAVALAAALSERLGRAVPAWLAWQHPTVAALGQGLAGSGPATGPAGVTRTSEAAEREPVAIVGIGCRLPGDVEDPQALWDFLVAGRDAVTEVPASRWDWSSWAGQGEPGTSVTRWGGFLSDVESFDHEHFTISPAEAEQMDPQQRIALETAWSALEDAGLDPRRLAGSRTGVFMGSMFEEYAAATGATASDTVSHSATGHDASVIPARIAYTWGLRGPVLGLQTACSSSLTSVHLAARSLQAGESDLALAGGVNLMLDPHTTVSMTAFGAMSPTGRCHPFGAEADGYVRAEGCGLVVLRRLSDAIAAGDTVYAVIAGSAVNGDGASNGLTAPSPEAQEELLHAAWADAGLDPRRAGYVEAHGTGTLLGDPIEAAALGAVFGRPRAADEPDLAIGSAKSNFGHLEPAAGVLGLIKASLCLHRGFLPPSLHASQPNPHIDFAGSRLRLVREAEPWTGVDRLAGVSSFGFGGSNAHVVLAAAPASSAALARVTGVGADPANPAHDEESGPAVALCFSGHGSQWPGMGAALLSVPVFNRAVAEVEKHSGLPLRQLMASGRHATDTATVQPLLFATQVATVEVLRSHGVRVDAVLGHSVGEVAAAVASGALTLAEGARVVTTWSSVVGEHLDHTGTVRVLPLPRAEVEDLIRRAGVEVRVSAELSADRTAVAGTGDALATLESRAADRLGTGGGGAIAVDIAYPAHGPGVEGVVEALTEALGEVVCEDTEIPYLSTVQGRGRTPGSELTADYWTQNTVATATVRDALASLPHVLGCDERGLVVVEVAPQRTLAGPIERTLRSAGREATVLTTGSPAGNELEHLAEVLDRLDELGARSVAATPSIRALPLASSSAEGLGNRARAIAETLESAPGELAGVSSHLARRASTAEHRAVAVGRTADEAARQLHAIAAGAAEGPEDGQDLVTGRVVRGDRALLFTGQGSQRIGMGRELAAEAPGFARHLRRVVAALDAHLDVPLDAVLDGATGPDGELLIDQTEYTQPALFALETALASWWSDLGLRPAALVGHSIGELTAAHVAGAMDLQDAARLVCARGSLMARCRDDGAMASLEATEEEVLGMITEQPDRISIAGLNGPNQTVVSGDRDAVEDVVAHVDRLGRRSRLLQVSRAFHSPHMDAALEEFEAVARSCTFHPTTVPVISTLKGEPLPDPDRLPEHWVSQLRGPVRFLDAVRRLERDGIVQYLECGPAPVLSTLAATCVTQDPAAGFVASLHPDRSEPESWLRAVARAFVTGTDVDWGLLVPFAQPQVAVPGHVFARHRHWATGSGVPAREMRRADAWWEAVAEEQVDSLAALLNVPADEHEALAAIAPYLAGFHRDLRSAPSGSTPGLATRWVEIEADPAPLSGRWVVVGGSATSGVLVRALTAAGADRVEVQTVSDALQLGTLADAEIAGVLVDLTDAACAEPGRLTSSNAARDALRIAQAMAAAPTGPPAWGLAREACAVDRTDTVEPAGAALWGLSQVAALETDHRWRGMVDVAAGVDEQVAQQVVALLSTGTEEHLALRAGVGYAQRLGTSPRLPAPAAWRPAGPVLVTGSGALAGHLAGWLVEHGASDVVLASRSGRGIDIGAATGQVHARACDVTDREAVHQLLTDLVERDLSPRTVIHAAGVLDDRLLPDVDAASLAAVADPKLLGAEVLDELTRDLDLDAFVLVSSVVGVLGNQGQAAYAMANAALDGVAARRRAAGLPGMSLAFGPWDGPGMASGPQGAQLRRQGLVPIAPRRALTAFAAAVSTGDSRVVADVAWGEAGAAYGNAPHRALLREIPQARSTEPAAAGGDVVSELAALPTGERAAHALAVIREVVASVLKVADPASIDPDRGFKDLGVDSMMAVSISQLLTRRTSVPAPRTITFDRPSARALAEWLLDQVTDDEATHAPERVSGTAPADGEPVAIVGVGLRLPGGATDLDSLWGVLTRGDATVCEVPAERLGRALAGDTPALASLVEDVDGFDAGFFGITPREAVAMDPQQRLLLETTWEGLESAGVSPRDLHGSSTGVFVGSVGAEYDTGTGDLYGLTGRLASFTAGRIAHHLGTQGPTYTVDTACSSSLTALHVARESLLSGECDLALAGGAQVIADAGMFEALGDAGALAPDGLSKTFSADANGYGRGEGAAVLVLMRLADAQATGAPILGLMLGSAVMHDGASSGITAPNGASQERVIRRALGSAGVTADSVGYVECHGTGTALGDPIEVNALAAAYSGRGESGPLRLGTAKSVIGHLEAAAGIAGVCKVLASLRHDALPATLNSTPRNPHVDWDELPVEVVDRLTPWPQDADRPRRAGVSAFGLSGTNVHLLVEQAPAPGRAAQEPNELLDREEGGSHD